MKGPDAGEGVAPAQHRVLRTGAQRASAATALLLTLVLMPPAAAQTDFSGIWMPAAELTPRWNTAEIALTDAGAQALNLYDRRRHDSVLFCMPYGTPRNVLSGAPYAVEILQRPEQITMIFDGRGDVRRIYLDARRHPPDPIANWMGHSVGAWDGASLTIDTVAMTSESRLNEAGLPHSEAMRLSETWRLIERGGEVLLNISIDVDDPVMYESPFTMTRFFRRSPHTMPAETAAHCQLDQWRDYLERHSKELSMQLREGPQTNTGATR